MFYYYIESPINIYTDLRKLLGSRSLLCEIRSTEDQSLSLWKSEHILKTCDRSIVGKHIYRILLESMTTQ